MNNIKYSMPADIIHEMAEKIEYWKRRCELAEKFIELHPCDPDIFPDPYESYRDWKIFKGDWNKNGG